MSNKPYGALIVYGYNHPMLYKTVWMLDKVLSLLILTFLFTGDMPRLTAQTDQVRSYTRAIEFDYPTYVYLYEVA